MATPFSEIDGVLMSFFFIMGKAELRFEAETVFKKDIPDKAFERRLKYRSVTREGMEKIITDLVNF